MLWLCLLQLQTIWRCAVHVMKTKRGGRRRSSSGSVHRHGEASLLHIWSWEQSLSKGSERLVPQSATRQILVTTETNKNYPSDKAVQSSWGGVGWQHTSSAVMRRQKNQESPHEDWGTCRGMQMIFSNNNNKRTKKEENPGNLQLLLLKAIGFPGDSWALWDTLAGCSRKNCCTGPPC